MTRGQFAVLIGTVTFLQSHCCQAQTINISLNLHYNNSADPAMGGNWTLVANTDGVHGIAGIDARLSNINIAGVAYQPGIGAMMNGGSPFVGTFGGAIDLVYFQDLSTPASVVPLVGRGGGTPGNLPLDALNDPAWDNAARILTGTFGAVRPAFTSVGAQSTDGNVLSSASAPFSVIDAAVTVVVRDVIVGDYNRNGTVDAADYVIWRKTLGAIGPGLSADGSGNNVVDEADFNLWRRGFGLSGGAALGAGSGLAMTSVPEPASAVTLLVMLTIGMMFHRRRRTYNTVAWLTMPALLLAIGMGSAERAHALPRAWVGVNNDWVDNGTAGFWSPADEPDADDEAIFNTADAVNLGSNNAIIALTMSNGIDLNTNNFDLDVNGLVQLVDASTNLTVGGADSVLTADSVTINNGGSVILSGGTIQVDEEAGNGLVDINAGGELEGHGTLSMTDALAAVTPLLINDGIINARRSPDFILGPPQVGTLSINATDADARIDLDGAGELGAVNVSRNQTLDINIQLADIFNGTITMAQNSILDMSNAWILGANATVDINNGATGGIPAVPAGVATIAGATFSQNSGTITVVDSDGTLKIDAPFTLNGGSFVNNGLVVFNSRTTIANAANMTMPTTSSSLRVEGAHTVTINQANFNMDGANAATNVITVTGDSSLTINTGDYDTDSATNAFDGTVNLDNSTININVTDAEFVMDGVLNSAASGSDQSLWTGDALDIGNDAGALDADVNISGSQPTQFGAQVDFNSDADMNVANGATAHFLAVVNFNSVIGGNNAQFTGGGELIFSAGVNFSEATTLNMVGGTVDLDGADSIGDAINIDAPLTINAELMRSFGKNNGGGGTNLLDINNSINTGSLTVDLDDADDEWTLNAQGVMNLVNDNTEATLLAGSDININGTVNVTGDVRTTARVDFGSTAVVNINTAAQPLRLSGGNNTDDPNTIAGGAIGGMGLLAADDGKELRGFGTINTSIDFDAASNLFADDGTLTINGAILDVARIGTFDADGVLNVVNPWDTSVASFVTLEGGTLQGGTMTINNGNGVSGEGLITAPLINNVRLRSSDGTLVVQTAGNNNDWDGAAGGGVLTAINVGTLELLDVGAAFGFTGTVEASTSSRVFTNGFALDFNPGSTLNLTSSTYESTSSTDIGGTVTVNAGAESRIKVENNFFLSFETGSSTTLNANLRLENNNIIIEQGATFSGAGALVVPDGSHMVGENLANIGVLLDMQGAFRPGNSEGIGRIDLFDYQQQDSSELFVELTGTALNAFDRLVASGDVVIDGFLGIDIDEVSPGVPFVPVLGQTFNIITGNTVTGEFDYADVSGMPAGLAFHIEYLPNAVQLQVVNKPIFSADFDDDGDVDKTDLAISDGAYDLNQLGDADGDNDTDGADLLIWQRQFGSHPGAGAGAVSAVPEPASLLLWLIGSLAAFARRR